MSGQKDIRARQVNIDEIAEFIGDRSAAINHIADGLAADNSAILTIATGVFASSAISPFLRLDGTSVMSAAIDVGGNAIVNVGNVDGRDVSADGTVLDMHVADATLHFTEAAIDHDNILNVGTNTHTQIDIHIADVTNPHATSVLNISDVTITSLTVNDSLVYDGLGWINQQEVVKFNGRTGLVTPVAGDYNASEIVNIPVGSIAATDLQAAINELDVDKANTTHTHTLDALQNVIAPTPNVLDILAFDGTNWVNSPNSSGGSANHDLLTNNGGVGSHATISAHIADSSIHYTEGSISHFNITDTGTNTHAQIDAHIADVSIHSSTLSGLSDVTLGTPLNQQVLTFTSTGNVWIASTIVSSFNSRTGAISPLAGDYTAVGVTSVPTATLLSSNTQSALNELDANNITLANRVTVTENDIATINDFGPVGVTFTVGTPFPTWTVVHGRNTRNFVYTILDSSNNVVIPNAVDATDLNQIIVTFNVAIAGRINVMFYS